MTSRVRRSASRAVSSATRDSSLASARRARRKPIGSSRNRRAANARASPEGGSSHCVSSIATTSGRVLGEHSNRTEDAERHRSALQPPGLRPSSQQRDLEGLALRVGEPPERSVRHVAEEITQRGERQSDLGLDRPAREHLQPPRTGVGDALPPERRLPDPGLTLDEQRDRSPGNRLQEVVNRIDLRLAPDDLQRRRHQPSSGSLIGSYSDYLIALAREAGADAVASGDNDLLGLRAKVPGLRARGIETPSVDEWRHVSDQAPRSTSMPARTTKSPRFTGAFSRSG